MPDNTVFSEFINEVTKSLGLDDPIAVKNSSDMIYTITKRDILAGVVFHSDAVSSKIK